MCKRLFAHSVCLHDRALHNYALSLSQLVSQHRRKETHEASQNLIQNALLSHIKYIPGLETT